ncbi:MAG: Asp/Glu/hydantoin racemase, partial [Bacteroidetes bacterium]|nr:Asp/Glu/hydantoin racemase [Bacteroidota bacterium]
MNQLLTYFSLLLLSIIVLACNSENVSKKNIVETILTEKNSYYYVDVENYPTENRSLPVGVFDSGTGGLTVLDAIL